MSEQSDTPKELCDSCKKITESSELEWVQVGGMCVGNHRQPLTWQLRDKYSSSMIRKNTKILQQLAAKSRELSAARAEAGAYELANEQLRKDVHRLFDENKTLTEQRDRLAEALKEIERTEPANHNGDLFYPRYTEDGDWAGDEPVDPYSLLAFIYPRISEALQSLTTNDQGDHPTV